MKKIITTIISTTILFSSIVQAQGIFNYTIPQPNLITNDWDGDGEPNSTDTDDDGDNIPDHQDDNPFSGRPVLGGGSSTGGYVYSGDTCEDGSLDQATLDSLNHWFQKSYTDTYWCGLTSVNFFFNASHQISEIPESIGALINLENLNLNGQKNFDTVPESIGNLKNLKTLYMSVSSRDGSLESIPDSIQYLTNLSALSIYGNKVTTLPNELNDLITKHSLIELDLRENTGSPFSNIDCSGLVDCYK